jgi:hypothetical protein
MIFFWRGRGFVVSLFTIVSLILLNLVADAIGGDGYYAAHVFPKLMAFLLAAAGVFLVARGDDGSHFFFIPLKAWPFIIAILGAVISFAVTDGTPAHAAAAPAVAEEKTAPVTTSAAMISTPQPAQPPQQTTTVAPAPAPEPEPAQRKFEQVYIDAMAKTYYPEGCTHPDNAVSMAKSAAKMQGYTLATTCR